MFNFGLVADCSAKYAQVGRLEAEIMKLQGRITMLEGRARYYEQLYILEKNKRKNVLNHC
jgi:hypothetical protein